MKYFSYSCFITRNAWDDSTHEGLVNISFLSSYRLLFLYVIYILPNCESFIFLSWTEVHKEVVHPQMRNLTPFHQSNSNHGYVSHCTYEFEIFLQNSFLWLWCTKIERIRCEHKRDWLDEAVTSERQPNTCQKKMFSFTNSWCRCSGVTKCP